MPMIVKTARMPLEERKNLFSNKNYRFMTYSI